MIRVFVVSSDVFTYEELRAYEQRILDHPGVTEQEASRFFAEFPKFLTIGGYTRIAREVVLYRPDQKAVYRVDFFRCRHQKGHWDFVELKSPKAKLLVKQGAHWHLGSAVYKGIEQAQDYREFLEDSANRLELQKRARIDIFQPRLLLVAGRSPGDVRPEDLIRVTSRQAQVDIRTYDDLHRFATANYRTPFVAIPIMQASDFPTFTDSDLKPIAWVQAAREGRSGAYPLPGGGYATLNQGVVYYGSGTSFQGDPGSSYARSKAAEIVSKHKLTNGPDCIERTLDEAFAFDGGRGRVDHAFWQEIQSRLDLDASAIADAIRKRERQDR